jgi:hypothetical protein
MKMSLKFHALKDEKRGALQSFLAGMEGAANRVWVHDHSYTKRGSFPATELLGNVAFDATTGWTASGELTLYATEGELRLTRTAATADQSVSYSQVTGLTSGAAYVMRAVMVTGKGSEAWGVRVGSTAGAATYIDSGIQTASGLAVKAATIAATTAYASLYDYRQDTVASPIVTRAAGDYQRFGAVSFSRCILVNGASQTGSALVVDGLPASTNGLLLPGDQVQVGDELKLVTAPLNSDSGGNGHLRFAPALRESPADNAPVIVHRPMGKFLLESNENGWESAPGVFSSAEVSLVESVE